VEGATESCLNRALPPETGLESPLQAFFVSDWIRATRYSSPITYHVIDAKDAVDAPRIAPGSTIPTLIPG